MNVKLPNPFRFAAAVGRAVCAFFRGRPVFASELLQREREATCYQCPEYLPETLQCKVCTCFVPIKVMLETERCPRGRW